MIQQVAGHDQFSNLLPIKLEIEDPEQAGTQADRLLLAAFSPGEPPQILE